MTEPHPLLAGSDAHTAARIARIAQAVGESLSAISSSYVVPALVLALIERTTAAAAPPGDRRWFDAARQLLDVAEANAKATETETRH